MPLLALRQMLSAVNSELLQHAPAVRPRPSSQIAKRGHHRDRVVSHFDVVTAYLPPSGRMLPVTSVRKCGRQRTATTRVFGRMPTSGERGVETMMRMRSFFTFDTAASTCVSPAISTARTFQHRPGSDFFTSTMATAFYDR